MHIKYTLMKKSIGTEYRKKLASVITSAKGIITPNLVSNTLHISPREAGRILSRWNKQGWVKRIKHGVYIPIAVEDITGNLSIEDSWILADKLFHPGYIAGFSAVKYWDLSEQIFETTTFFTTKNIREHNPIINNSRFQLKTIADYKMFGTKPIWRENSKILVSDASKTIVDLLDDPRVAGGMRVVKDIFLEYSESKFFDIELIIAYTKKMRNKTIFKRFGFLLETLNLSDLVKKYDLINEISKGYSIFDPTVKNPAIITRWNLRIPQTWKKKNDSKKRSDSNG